MKLHSAFSAMLAAFIAIIALGVAAKDPHSPTHSVLPIFVTRTGSLTPPPKEWAMFPQDEPPAQAPQNPPPGQNATPPAGAKGQGAAGSGDAAGGIVSAANVHPAPVSHRELPLFWLLVTGGLSLCAVLTCGTLVLRKDDVILGQNDASEHDLPVVSEAQEIRG